MRGLPSRFRGASSVLFGTTVAVMTTVAVVGLGPGLALAEEAPTPGPETTEGTDGGAQGDPNLGPATPGEVVCSLTDTKLDAVSGMVVTQAGIYAVEAGDANNVIIFTVDAATCASTSKTYTFNPVDPQDLAIGSDGALWVADIGDKADAAPSRERVALEKAVIGETKAVPYRVVYPGGAKVHAEAMILDATDLPIIITQEGGKAGVYKAGGPLVADATSNLPELVKVGDFTPQATGTENPLTSIGNTLVTGAAKSPDGKKVVVRTASDAYEFEVGEDGDIAKAIVEGTPVVTPLPNEPAGGAIAYSLDGTKFLTLSAKGTAAEAPKLLSYTPHVPPPPAPIDETPTNEGASEQGWLEKLSFSELTRIVSAVGVVGLVLAIAGIVGIRRARRRRREEDEYDDYDDYDDDPRGRRGRGRGRGGRGGRDDYQQGYGEQEQGYADAGYGGNGYGGGQYADAGYGGRANNYAANGYGANGYAQPGYEADPYAQPQYGAQQQGYDQGGYGAADQYGAQPGYGADQYGGQQGYGADQYGGQQGYGGGGQQYPGYGYEEDFDPMQDPRRR